MVNPERAQMKIKQQKKYHDQSSKELPPLAKGVKA